MKTFRFILIVFLSTLVLAGCYSSNRLGTEQKDRQMSVLEAEIKKVQDDILYYQYLAEYDPASSDQYKEKNRLALLKLSSLQARRDSIIFGFITGNDVPRELQPRELDARLRGNVIRRQELVLGKIETNMSETATSPGLKVIVANDYWLPVTFKFEPLDGGEKISINISSGRKEYLSLIPGQYLVHYLNGGKEISRPAVLNLDGSKHNYQGEHCFGYVYMPKR